MSTAGAKNSAASSQTDADRSHALLAWGLQVLALAKETEPRRDSNGERAASEPTLDAADGQLLQGVIEQLQRLPSPLHAAPSEQPVSVHELTPALFSRYEVEGGRVHLAGCQLEERPLIRLTFLDTGANAADEATRAIVHRYFLMERNEPKAEGRAAPAEHGPTSSSFGFRLVALDDRSPLYFEKLAPPLARVQMLVTEEVIRAIHAARQACLNTDGDPALTTLVWCKYAVGKLRIVIGDNSVDLPFEGWAAQIQHGAQSPPAWECPWTGIRSYRLAATDDGRITSAEAIAQCHVTGRRVLRMELETCAVTRFLALPEYLATCPVTGDRLLQSELRLCAATGLAVSPRALRGGKCAALRTMKSIRKDDPRLARLLAEYPTLDQWHRWKLAETSRADFFYSSQWLRQMLLVVDRESLEPLSLTTADTWFSSWRPADAARQKELLGR